MVPILVLVTFAVAIVITPLFFRRRRVAPVSTATSEVLSIPPRSVPAATHADSFLHPGHVWVRVGRDGTATLGATDFAANFVGALSGIDTPATGRVLRQGAPAWTLVSRKNRRLTQVMPVDGEILEVNRASDPSWILRVRVKPRRVAENLRNLFGGALAETWQEMAGLRLNAALVPALGRTAQDGGVWMKHFGDLLEDSEWNALRRDLFPSATGDDLKTATRVRAGARRGKR